VITIIALAGCLAEAALLYALLILLRLSKKLGAVRRMPSLPIGITMSLLLLIGIAWLATHAQRQRPALRRRTRCRRGCSLRGSRSCCTT